MNIAQTLNDYLQALQMRGLSAALNPAANLDEIKNFENEHGIRLPEVFVQLYQKFNGQMNELIPPSEPRWLSLEEIFSKQQDWQDFCQTHYGKQWENIRLNHFDGRGCIKNTLFHPFWLPFMADESGFYCLDYDPDKNGQVTQVIYIHLQTTLEKTNLIHLANNFTIWFENHVNAFQTRRTAVTLQTLLEEYLVYQKANPALFLNPPAKTESISLKETFLMVKFPHSLIKIWAEFNGYQNPDSIRGDYWIPVEKIESIQQKWRDSLQEKLNSNPETTIRPMAENAPNIKPYYYNPLWIPIYTNQTVMIALDFDPADSGSYGQPLVIYNQFDYLITSDSDTFDEWLYHFLSYYLYPEDEAELIHSEFFASDISMHYQYYLGIPDGAFGIESLPFELNFFWFSSLKHYLSSALITCGNSNHLFQDLNGKFFASELMILLPEVDKQDTGYPLEYEWALNILTIASQGLQNYNSEIHLQDNYLIPNGIPMTAFEGTNFKGVLITKPKNDIFPEDFYLFNNRKGETIKILLVIPLYEEEIDYILKNNQPDLVMLIGGKKINELADIKRPSLLTHIA